MTEPAAPASIGLMVDLIISLDGYASGVGWPGFWGLEGPEYLAWLAEDDTVARDGQHPHLRWPTAATRVRAHRDCGPTRTPCLAIGFLAGSDSGAYRRSMPQPIPLPKTSAPAARALTAAGITSLDDLRDRDVDALAQLHGVGPKAIQILKAALAEKPAAAQN
jgi:hypothetical protein